MKTLGKRRKAKQDVNTDAMAEEIMNNLQHLSEEELDTYSALDLIDALVERSRDCRLTQAFFNVNAPIISRLSAKLGLNEHQALLVAIATEHMRAGLDIDNVSDYFSCTNAKAMCYKAELEEMYKQGMMRKRCEVFDCNYYLTDTMLKSLSNDEQFVPQWKRKLTDEEFVDEIQKVIELLEGDDISLDEAMKMLRNYFSSNSHLTYVTGVNELHLPDLDFVLLVFICQSVLSGRCSGLRVRSVTTVLGRRYKGRVLEKELTEGNNLLQDLGLVEYVNGDGQATPDHVCITEKTKKGILADYDLSDVFDQRAKKGLVNCEDLVEKTLYYNPAEEKQIARLKELLEEDNFKDVRARMKEAGMRTGFACLFYGSPGTGKTETIYQLARLTGRCIMEVDID
ncbi:MAG: hypothetical protein Q4B68_07735 [Bacteroidales bacterium]|nr:hypothetical protein [Bacteroidales bacterium]